LYAKALVHDLDEVQMTAVPANGYENHPAWTLGHLISGSAGIAEDLGAKFEMPVSWVELFLRAGPGDPRKPDPGKEKYPSKATLLNELEHQHNKVKQLLSALNNEDLDTEFKWRFTKYMPTLGDLLHFMCVNHESMHLVKCRPGDGPWDFHPRWPRYEYLYELFFALCIGENQMAEIYLKVIIHSKI
jgi:hypothetical protein